MAIAIEDCNLHRRVALNVLNSVGTSPRLLLVGFMLPTAFLSMWISNTAACAMMIPILEAILAEIITTNEGKGVKNYPLSKSVQQKPKKLQE